jgi:hypothetical protein
MRVAFCAVLVACRARPGQERGSVFVGLLRLWPEDPDEGLEPIICDSAAAALLAPLGRETSLVYADPESLFSFSGVQDVVRAEGKAHASELGSVPALGRARIWEPLAREEEEEEAEEAPDDVTVPEGWAFLRAWGRSDGRSGWSGLAYRRTVGTGGPPRTESAPGLPPGYQPPVLDPQPEEVTQDTPPDDPPEEPPDGDPPFLPPGPSAFVGAARRGGGEGEGGADEGRRRRLREEVERGVTMVVDHVVETDVHWAARAGGGAGSWLDAGGGVREEFREGLIHALRRFTLLSDAERALGNYEEEGAFDALQVEGRPPVDRMKEEYLNAPKNFRPAREDKFLLSLLLRTLNRLVNEAVQREHVLPPSRRRRMEAALHPANAAVTRLQAAEQFLHASRRSYWSDAMFDSGIRLAPGLADVLLEHVARFREEHGQRPGRPGTQ